MVFKIKVQFNFYRTLYLPFSGRNRGSYVQYIFYLYVEITYADSVKVGLLIINSFLQNIFLLSQTLSASF